MVRLYAANGIKYFKQTANIDLTGQKWTPFEFGGYFDGNGKTISNVTIDLSSTYYVGFFRKLLTGGELTGIKLENVNVKGNLYVGGLVGTAYTDTIISNSYASGSVSGSSIVGGLVGTAYTDTIISNSYASGSVSGFSGSNSVGGLVGATYGISISSSYYDSQTTNQSDTGKGIPRTTDEMKQGVPTLSTVPRPIYVDWSTSIWDFGDATDYPTLK